MLAYALPEDAFSKTIGGETAKIRPLHAFCRRRTNATSLELGSYFRFGSIPIKTIRKVDFKFPSLQVFPNLR